MYKTKFPCKHVVAYFLITVNPVSITYRVYCGDFGRADEDPDSAISLEAHQYYPEISYSQLRTNIRQLSLQVECPECGEPTTTDKLEFVPACNFCGSTENIGKDHMCRECRTRSSRPEMRFSSTV